MEPNLSKILPKHYKIKHNINVQITFKANVKQTFIRFIYKTVL